MNTVYNYWDRTVAFEGTNDECRKWLLEQGFHMKDGRIIFRNWTEDGDKIWDMDGKVYIFNEKTSC